MLPFFIVTPAEAGAHRPTNSDAAEWVPACPTDQVRGLKAHGMTAYLGE